MADPGAERYTHGHHASVLRSHVWRTAENSCAYLLDRLEPRDRILDVGCGPGSITVDLARRVPGGHVLGVDAAADVLARAREAAQAAGVANVSFVPGDVYELTVIPPDLLGAPDVVHAHQVLQHLARPVDALRQMGAVARPGGLVAVRDADYAAMAWYPELPALTRWREIYSAVTRRNGGEPDAGRRLLGWVQAADLAVESVGSSTWCFATPEARSWWGGLWADRSTRSDLARMAVDYEVSDAAELAEVAAGWREWAEAPDGWFSVTHGEVLARSSRA